ncbi:MAG: serine/threonine protein kinase [Alphaproteobacteria bacterium]|nr:serine/threonine protein kinase [Alphaproteobacteria bacterium]
MPSGLVLDTARGMLGQAIPAWQDVAIRRLGFVGRLAAGFGLGGLALVALRQDNLGDRAAHTRPWWPLALWVVASALMAWGVARPSPPAARRVDLGLVWLVLSCVLAAVFRHGLPYVASDVVRGVSPVAVALLLFAVIIPVPPRRFLLAAVLGVLADPLVLGAFVTRGHPMPPWNLWLWLHAPDLFALPLAWVTATSLFDLRAQAERAQEMGAWRLERRLGAGGMGEVWVARHRRLAQPVAVKLVRPGRLTGSEASRADLLARFEREARVTAQLRSPHTIRVFDFGTTEDGVFYYAMELLDGVDLDRLVADQGPLPPARVRHVLLQICDALAEAHEAGLVHRDVKPANVMLCRRGTVHDVATVLDFGLAREVDPEAAQLTAGGALLGSPVAMAPEMAQRDQATPRSDLYGLGCIAFWLLAGEHVFRAGTVGAWLVAHATETPRPLGAVAPQPIPRDLERLVARLLAKDPADRPASAREVAEALEALDLPAWTSTDAAASWARGEGHATPSGDPVDPGAADATWSPS